MVFFLFVKSFFTNAREQDRKVSGRKRERASSMAKYTEHGSK